MSVDEVLLGEGRRRARATGKPPNDEPWIVVVSHCDLSEAHPDPHGKQLLRLIEMMELEQTRPDRAHFFPSKTMGDYAVFHSWCSLYQPPESEAIVAAAEEVAVTAVPPPLPVAAAVAEARAAALADIDLWYTHQLCRLVVLDVPAKFASSCAPRLSRGWANFEISANALLRHTVHARARVPPPLFAAPCRPHVPPPRTAAAFAQLLAGTSAKEAERAALSRAYGNALDGALLCAEVLHFGGCGWGDEECQSLAEVLPLFVRAKTLNLSRNLKITDAGIAAIAAALVQPGAAPRLREVNLQHVPYGLQASDALREVSRVRDIIWYV